MGSPSRLRRQTAGVQWFATARDSARIAGLHGRCSCAQSCVKFHLLEDGIPFAESHGKQDGAVDDEHLVSGVEKREHHRQL